MRFLADESCDFAVVTALRAAGHDVNAIIEINPRAKDSVVLDLARSEARVLLTEDKDFGLLAYAGGHQTAGVLLIRFPNDARSGRSGYRQTRTMTGGWKHACFVSRRHGARGPGLDRAPSGPGNGPA